MSNINIFFYSSNCKYCYNLMKILKNINLLKNFKLIQTDNNNNLPPQITAVPTLVIAGYSKLLVCEDAFQWVNNMNNIRKEKTEIKTELEYVNNNFSDLFSFIDNNNNPQSHNFINPNDKSNYIFTAPELKKIDSEEQMKIVNEKLNSRNEQDNYFKSEMRNKFKE
jgi:hypothetical protein